MGSLLLQRARARGLPELKAAGMPCGGLSLSGDSPWAGEPRAVLGNLTSDELHLFYNFPRNGPADTKQHVLSTWFGSISSSSKIRV